MNLLQLLHRNVADFSDTPALAFKQNGKYHFMTYSELWQRILSVSQGLKDVGVGKGDKVALLATSCPEWPISDYALLTLEAVVVPIYPTLPADQVGFILANAEVSVAIVEDRSQFEKVCAAWPKSLNSVVVMKPDSMPQRVDPEHPWLPFQALLSSWGAVDEDTLAAMLSIPDDTLATIVHTSGTSGRPKGVMLTHGNLVSNVQACLRVIPVEKGDIGLSYLPLSHIFERTVGQFISLTAGGTIAYAENLDTIVNNLLEIRPTILVTVPRLLEKVYAKLQERLNRLPGPLRRFIQSGLCGAEASRFARAAADRLVYRKVRAGLGGRMRLIVSGGAALSKEVADFFIHAGIPVHEGYGMTESAPVIAANPWQAIRTGTVGRPIPGVTIRIAEDGELLVQGPNVMAGYYRDPDETARTLADGWLHTGDIAETDDGYVRIVDRKKHLLVLATGKNVAPGPIETEIANSPYVSAAVVLGDKRKFVTCLVCPDFQSLAPLAQRLRLPEGDTAAWISNPEIQALFAREIAEKIKGFASFEQPKRAILVPTEFTVDSGELTPTLKVRNKIIQARYGPQIEEMYSGSAFIPIQTSALDAPVTATEPTSGTAAASVTETVPTAAAHRPSRRPRKTWVTAAAIGVALVLACGASLAVPHLPKSLDVLQMVKGILSSNNRINAENDKVVSRLQHIDDLADATGQMSTDLHSLGAGTRQDEGLLKQLNGLSEQEVQLSQQFYQLAQQLDGKMTRIGKASTEQNNRLIHMGALAGQVFGTASSLASVNRQVAGQLQQSDRLARTAEYEMP